MASRNRNRQAPVKDDADEERSLWNQLVTDAKRVDGLISLHNTKWNRMQEIKELLEIQHGNGEETSGELEDELMKLSRENLRLCEEIASALEGPSENEPTSLLGSINILRALRQSSELDTYSAPPPRTAATNVKTSRNPKRKAGADTSSVVSADDRDSIAADSPATVPSTKVVIPSSNRLKVHSSSSRAGSAAPTSAREASVKIEEGLESGTEQLSKGIDSKSKPISFVRGAEVFYRSKKATHPRGAANMGDDQGEGILCTITAVMGDGKSRRYEVIDVDDDNASPYKASINQLVAIPANNDGLPDPALRRTVLAMYPGTTTFYRAEVTAVKGKDLISGHVKLRFEDEDEKNKESVVEKRYVLSDWPR